MGRGRFVSRVGFALALALGSLCRAQAPSAASNLDDCRPAELRSLLSADDRCVVGKACGRISRPWLYRGPRGRRNGMRFYGERTLKRQEAQELAAMLLRDAVIDSASQVAGIEIPCEAPGSAAVYVASFSKGDSLVHAVLRFDTGQVLFFGNLTPLGSVAMGANADSLWLRLSAALDWDARLAGPRPQPSPPEAPRLPSLGAFVDVEELPDVLKKVAPVYPDIARAADVSGLVMIQALVNEKGTVEDAVAAEGPPMLYDAALEAVWQWTFKPARSKGEAIPVWVAVPVKFTLR